MWLWGGGWNRISWQRPVNKYLSLYYLHLLRSPQRRKSQGVNPGIICTKSKFGRPVSLSPGPADNFGWVSGILRNMWKGGQRRSPWIFREHFWCLGQSRAAKGDKDQMKARGQVCGSLFSCEGANVVQLIRLHRSELRGAGGHCKAAIQQLQHPRSRSHPSKEGRWETRALPLDSTFLGVQSSYPPSPLSAWDECFFSLLYLSCSLYHHTYMEELEETQRQTETGKGLGWLDLQRKRMRKMLQTELKTGVWAEGLSLCVATRDKNTPLGSDFREIPNGLFCGGGRGRPWSPWKQPNSEWWGVRSYSSMSEFTLPTGPQFSTAGHLRTAVSLTWLLSLMPLLLMQRNGRVNFDEM